ncbi:flagellar hook assembly protein FlgD [Thalassobacillus pellis]|uniref:flagellar hook assembly protein FlgD n=1 Tax=Thalassobacillus pellis TaxID=748008 RepID=UPI00195F9154|nr:flagellar hook assembly protein FlgD [Thalassobacillus pellis]MBM7552746.1 flagellar basal-body rod modification protein FlgD [Thalassobacillus pellis]
MPKIDSTLYLNNSQTRGSVDSKLDKNDFLKILMTQLQNQDPMNPMQDKEFISQMTSFSSLEQMMNVAEAMDKLSQSQSFAPMVKYSSLIGKEVTYQITDAETGEIQEEASAEVKAVSQKEGQVQMELHNGETINVNAIIKVSEQL